MSRHRFARDAASVLSSQYFTRGILVVRGLVAAAVLGPAVYGAWSALSLILEYGSYAGAGAIQGLDLRLPAAVARDDAAESRRLMAGAWSAIAVGALLFVAVLGVYLGMGGHAFLSSGAPDLPWIMAIAAIGGVALQYGTSALRAFGRIPASSLALAIQSGLGGLLGIALVRPFGLHGLAWGWLAGTLLAWVAVRVAGREVPWWPAAPRTGVALVATGAPLFGFFLSTLLLRSADRLTLVRFASPATLGLYTLAAIASATVLHVPESAAYVLLPRLAASAGGARDPEQTRAETLRLQRALMMALPAVVGIAILFAEPIVAAVLPAYRAGVPALRILSLGALLLAGANLPGYALLAERRVGDLARGVAPGIAAGVAIVFVWVSRHPDPTAAAIASAAAYALVAVLVLWRAARTGSALAGAGVGRLIVTSLAPSVWAGAAVLLLARVGDGARWPVAIVRAAALLAVYAPAVWLFGRGLGLRALLRAPAGANG